jgi:polygalacturonase
MAIYRGPGGPGDATPDAGNSAQVAQGFANDAANSAAAAAQSASNAASSAAAALAAKNAAELAENNAELAENNAELAENNAVVAQLAAEAAQIAAENAQTNAEAAQLAAELAETDAGNAQLAAEAAQLAAEAAQLAAENAQTAAEAAEANAALSEANALASEQAAALSESNALASEQAAALSESNALASEQAAALSESNAAYSESNAALSEANALASEQAAALSESNALASEQAAALSEANALASEQAAALSESNALASEQAAALSEANALASEQASASLYDQFDDRYLGAKSSAPTVDNDGDPLLVGALYWNTVFNEIFVWDGTNWITVVATNSQNVTYQPAGTGAASTDVQSKLRESVSVKDFGAVGDGITDDTAAIQTAINFATIAGVDLFVPAGEYKIKNDGGTTAFGVNLKSNVTVHGEGDSSVLSAFASNTNGYVIGARRAETSAAIVNFGLRDLKVVGPLALVGTRVSSTILIDWAENVLIQNVTSINGSDACIRVTGYGSGTFTNDILSSFWNNTFNVTIKDCNISNGYLGIEVEGGAENVLISGCRIDDISTHGIRIPSGYNVQCVNNTLINMQGRGFWVDRHRDILIDGNYVECVGDSSSYCVSLGGFDSADPDDNSVVSTNVIVTNNILLSTNAFSFTDDFQGSSTKFTEGVVISNNTVKGDIFILNSKKFTCSNNQGTGDVEPWQGGSTGFVTDNLMPLRSNSGGYVKRAGNGGNIAVFNNIDSTTFKPTRPLVQGGYAGVSDGVPTAGTWETGHWVQNGLSAPGLNNQALPFGFICIAGGSPGTWVPIGQPVNQYSRSFAHHRSANNETRTILQFTVPNGNYFLRLIVDAVRSRAPSSSPSTSRMVHQEFAVGRNVNSNCVIDSALSTNNFSVVTTTAGGSNAASDPAIALTIASGGSSDPQVLTLTAAQTTANVQYLTANIMVQSTSILSTFGL